jgi:hypothetical protein
MNHETLLPLVARLRACPTQASHISEKRLRETWKGFTQTDLEHGDERTPAILAALILYDDEPWVGLLNEVERSQLFALAKVASERYQQIAHPPNKLGKTIAASLKEAT